MNDDLPFSPGKSKNQLMVVGGGIAGMEAALTAANMGLLVYLVDNARCHVFGLGFETGPCWSNYILQRSYTG